jgi:hypothetical protein
MPSRKIDTLCGHVIFRKVSELIDPILGERDEAIIQDIFNPLDAQKVLEIPLSQNLEEDFVAWHKTKSFTYSVRSAYYLEWRQATKKRWPRCLYPKPHMGNSLEIEYSIKN